jgi:hypothetical protein
MTQEKESVDSIFQKYHGDDADKRFDKFMTDVIRKCDELLKEKDYITSTLLKKITISIHSSIDLNEITEYFLNGHMNSAEFIKNINDASIILNESINFIDQEYELIRSRTLN